MLGIDIGGKDDIYFGQNCFSEDRKGTISVGDLVTVF